MIPYRGTAQSTAPFCCCTAVLRTSCSLFQGLNALSGNTSRLPAMYLYVRPTLLYRLRGLAVAWKSRYLMLTSDRRPRHPVYRAGTAT